MTCPCDEYGGCADTGGCEGTCGCGAHTEPPPEVLYQATGSGFRPVVAELPHLTPCVCTTDNRTDPPTVVDYDCGRLLGVQPKMKIPITELSQSTIAELADKGVIVPGGADMVNHPPHYAPMPGVDFECIVVTREMAFDSGNSVKYMWRTDLKNGREDIKKARWYLDDAIRHADPVYIGNAPWQWEARLHVVARAQSNPNRSGFFNAIRMHLLENAQQFVDRILDDRSL